MIDDAFRLEREGKIKIKIRTIILDGLYMDSMDSMDSSVIGALDGLMDINS